MADITDAGPRLKAMNDALEGYDQMRAEIERLRLTDAEREAIQAAAVVMDARNRVGGPVMFRGPERATTLRGLLERVAL